MGELITAIYVEDEPSVLYMMIQVLELAGIQVASTYGSGEELLADTDTPEYEKTDVFIFDVRLPGITGLELAEILRAQGETRPIVAVSAWPAPEDEALDEIGVVFVRKPFLFSELEEKVKALVRG
jgi:DNA-binding response OmpR family regulator